MCWRLVRDGAVGTINLRSGVRKVLTYLALFLASATIIGDIITLIIQFLGGTANVRVWLKVLVVLLIGAWVIYYYWASLKREERDQLTSNRWQKTNGYVFIVVALAALFVGFTLSGNPQDQQGVVRDQQRVSDLQQLYAGVQSFYQQKGKMPQTLEEASSGYLSTLPQDPQTGTAYEYTALSGSSFELCATFETDDAVRGRPTEPLIYPVGSTNWTHPSGRHCFNLDAKPVGLLKP
jgi:flagellar basal body-associated protein FliL